MRLESEVNKHVIQKLEQERDMYKRNWDKTLKENEKLERENEKLRKQYTTLTDHIRLKASANPGVDRYIALVNFIDRLEQK